MSQPEDVDVLGTNWSVVIVLISLSVFLGVLASHQDNSYWQSVLLEMSAGTGFFVAIKVLLGRDVDEDERIIAFFVGILGVAVTIWAAFLKGFSQSLAIELGMGACLFCVLDVLIVDKLKRKIKKVKQWQSILSMFGDVDDEQEERMLRALGEWYFGEGWEPGDPIGAPGGIPPEDHERYRDWPQ